MKRAIFSYDGSFHKENTIVFDSSLGYYTLNNQKVDISLELLDKKTFKKVKTIDVDFCKIDNFDFKFIIQCYFDNEPIFVFVKNIHNFKVFKNTYKNYDDFIDLYLELN